MSDTFPPEQLPEQFETPEFPEIDNEPFEDFGVDPETIVTIRPGAGEPKWLVVSEPTPFSELMLRAGLTFNGQVDLYVEGQPIQMDDLVRGGQTVTMIGNVKGGK
jgi:hypothetical protein